METNLNKRNFVKYLSITFFTFFLIPFELVKSATKKVVNKNLTKKLEEIQNT